jgi:hypothetical protein
MKKIYVTLLGLLMISYVGYSQVSGYTYTQSTAAFTPLTLGQSCSPSGTTFDDEYYYTPGVGTPSSSGTTGPGLTLPFTFTYNGIPCNAVGVSANGWLKLKPTANPTVTAEFGYRVLSSTATGANYAIAAMTNDNEGKTAASLKYQVVGTSPNRSFVVEWLGFKRYGAAYDDDLNFQIRLNENNTITIHYGNCTSTYTGSVAEDGFQVGLKGSAPTDYKNLVSATTWNNPPYGATNTATDEITYESGIVPANGTRYTWAAASCAGPTNISISSASATSLNATWTAAPSATAGYQYAFSTSSTPPASGTATTTTSASATGQPANTVIYLHVRSNCGGAFSGWVTKAFVPCVTSNVSPANGATGITPPPQLVWNTVVGATGYTIMWSTNGGTSYANIGTIPANSPQFITDTVVITGTTPATQYYWYVRPNVVGDTASISCATGAWSLTTAAAVSNDNCAGAITLTPVLSCPTSSVTTYTTLSASNSGVVACVGTGADDDVWFKFVATSTSHSVTLIDSSNFVVGSSGDFVHEIFSGTCAGLTSIKCSDPENSSTSGLTIGTTYYVRVHTYGTGSFGKFTICISIPPAPPANDSCGAPITLTNGVGVAGTTLSASQSLAPSTCGIFTASAPTSDVWYKVTALSNGALSISSTTTDGNYDAVLILYSGIPAVGCVGLTQLDCADATGGGGTETINYATAVAGTTYYIRAYDYAGQGTFTITASGPALPISLLSFTGIKQDKTNLLNWSTASETNNRGFELQRSANGNDFTSITFVNSKAIGGNSSAQLNYSFSDITPLGGTNYYRLKQVDKDGRFAMSKVVAIKGLKPTSLQLVGVYPNPAVNKLNVNIESPVVDFVTLVVTDMTGKVLMNKMKAMAVGDNNVELNVSTLPAGSYFIKAVCANGCETSTAKFVKQ